MKSTIFGMMVAALALTASTSYAATAPANLLTNGGFETGDLTGWTITADRTTGFGVGTDGQAIGAGFFIPSAVEVHSGTYALWAALGDGSNQILSLSQTLSLGAGNFETGFYFGVNRGPVGIFSQILLDGNVIAQSGAPIGAGFQLESANFSLASAGIHTLTYFLNRSGYKVVGISADDFTLVGPPGPRGNVPEPASIALLALGLTGLALSRRRFIK